MRWPLALLIMLQLRGAAKGEFVGISARFADNRTRDVGCFPMSFSGVASAAAARGAAAVAAFPTNACSPLRNGAAVKGKVLVAMRGGCSFDAKATNAVRAGAIGLVVVNNQENQVPVLGQQATPWSRLPNFPALLFPCCMAWGWAWPLLVGGNRSTAVRFPLDRYQRYKNSEQLPLHEMTTLRVLSPSKLCYGQCPLDLPLKQATFNPSNYPSVVAPIVWATFSADCSRGVGNQGFGETQRCQRCYKNRDAFVNSAAFNGSVVFVNPLTRSSCFSLFYELLWLIQQHGARAVVYVDAAETAHTLLPSIVPFHVKIPMFSLYRSAGDFLLNAPSQVVVRTPLIQLRSGSAFVTDLYKEGLEDTFVDVEGQRIRVGQASYNPDYGRESAADCGGDCRNPSLALVRARANKKCSNVADCRACFAEGNPLARDASATAYKAKVVLVNQSDFSCLPYVDFALYGRKLGATAVLLVLPPGEPMQTLKVRRNGPHHRLVMFDVGAAAWTNLTAAWRNSTGPWRIVLPTIRRGTGPTPWPPPPPVATPRQCSVEHAIVSWDSGKGPHAKQHVDTSHALFGRKKFNSMENVRMSMAGTGKYLACKPLSVSLAGKVALVQRGSCFFVAKMRNVMAAGAVFMAVYNHVQGQTIIMASPAHDACADCRIPGIFLTRREGLQLQKKIVAHDNVTVSIHCDRSVIGGPPPPPSTTPRGRRNQPWDVTQLEVLRPATVAGSFTAGQAQWNPSTSQFLLKYASVAKFPAACRRTATCNLCAAAVVAQGLVAASGSVAIRNSILLFDPEQAPCIAPLHNIVLFAQRSGASAVLVLTRRAVDVQTLGPERLPFRVLIPTFTLPHQSARQLLAAAASQSRVQIRLPPIIDGRAPTSLGSGDDIDQVDGTLTCSNAALQQCRSNGATTSSCVERSGAVSCICPAPFAATQSGDRCRSTQCTAKQRAVCKSGVPFGASFAVHCLFSWTRLRRFCDCPVGLSPRSIGLSCNKQGLLRSGPPWSRDGQAAGGGAPWGAAPRRQDQYDLKAMTKAPDGGLGVSEVLLLVGVLSLLVAVFSTRRAHWRNQVAARRQAARGIEMPWRLSGAERQGGGEDRDGLGDALRVGSEEGGSA